MAGIACIICKKDLQDAGSYRADRYNDALIYCNRCYRYRGRNRRFLDRQPDPDTRMATIEAVTPAEPPTGSSTTRADTKLGDLVDIDDAGPPGIPI